MRLRWFFPFAVLLPLRLFVADNAVNGFSPAAVSSVALGTKYPAMTGTNFATMI